MIDEPGSKKKTNVFLAVVILMRKKKGHSCSFIHPPIHKGREVFGHFIQADDELVIQVFFLQICYLGCSEIEKFLLLLLYEQINTF